MNLLEAIKIHIFLPRWC